MLTKRDLNNIDSLITRRIREELVPVKKELAVIKKDVGTTKTDIVQIRKDMKILINHFDREYLELRKRVERLESHLNLPPLS